VINAAALDVIAWEEKMVRRGRVLGADGFASWLRFL
jgi:hypothetical protein